MTQPEEVEFEILKRENRKLRHLLFMQHGSAEHYLYGDDGERHCNTCWIDFNTDPVDVIEQKMHDYGMKKLIEAQSVCSHAWEPFKFSNKDGYWTRCKKCWVTVPSIDTPEIFCS